MAERLDYGVDNSLIICMQYGKFKFYIWIRHELSQTNKNVQVVACVFTSPLSSCGKSALSICFQLLVEMKNGLMYEFEKTKSMA